MSTSDITTDAVFAAIRAGDDDIYKLAETFGVSHVNATLRHAVYELGQAEQIRVTDDVREPRARRLELA
jgi:hypothetical protein